ncbi:MAG: cytidylate kinase-like family protein [Prolixibacteraceae bacterium]|jgi:cytidylate kinase|nr:cytidylate kinase-like family protein [Prolixibacteraceae bacterium]
MEDSLLLYLNKRMGKKDEGFCPGDILPGPVVTISREVGCAGVKLAKKLAGKLNEQGGKCKWKVFSKEIFEEAARELEMDRKKLKTVLNSEGRNTFDEILGALGDKRFKSERKIRKTVAGFIRSIATDGHCIIVGRGGHLIARDIRNSLHLRFKAPLDWRVKKIARRHRISETEALKFIGKTEKERESFRRNIQAGAPPDENYDMEINVSVFRNNDIIEIIAKAMIMKGLVMVPKEKTTAAPVPGM